jgi:hypothetical protein
MPNCILQCTIHYIGMDKLFNSINGSAANNIYILYLLLGTFHLFSFSFHFIIFHVHRIQAATCVCCVSGPSLHVHRHVRRTAPPVKKKKKRKKSSRYYVGCQYANHFTLSLPARRRCSTVYLLKSIASASM